ncbi:glycoside hydrolase family 15 protein [Methanocaldococcus indicus]|uniref:glycoside hydrolase family 15 protein n=1 Tax=Methanocaldococcus indicus TaxID=213231 RepID=UPI003C6D20CD
MIVGNSSLLAKIDDYGEIEYLFYPHVGYEYHNSNIGFAIYLDNVIWYWDDSWEINQKYLDNTNIHLTTYENDKLSIYLYDFVPPSHNVIIRKVILKNKLDEDIKLKFFSYENIKIGEHPKPSTTKYINGKIIKYNEDYMFIIGGDKRPTSFQCGNRYDKKSAYIDIENGILSENSESYGELTDSALCWDIKISKNKKSILKLFIMPKKYDKDISIYITQHNILINNYNTIKELSLNYWKNLINIEDWISEEYKNYLSLAKRAILLLNMLCDKNGGIIAAPTIFPDYRYVWGRDGSYMAVALSLYRQKGLVEKFFEFMFKIQNVDGSWLQNYFVDGSPRLTALQIDQVGSVLWALRVYYRIFGNREFIEKYWNNIKKAGDFLSSSILKQCYDLWEEKFGVFAYTVSTIYGGLRCAYSLSKAVDKLDEVKHWEKSLKYMKKEIPNMFYSKEERRFLKSINPVNKEIDSSILGLAYPYGLVDIDDKRMIETAETIERAFKYKVGGIGRYPEDTYFGGNPWLITTLWLSLYYRKLGQITNDEVYTEKSKKLFNWVIKNIYNFPEQIHKDLGIPISAEPLGWSIAMFLIYLYKNDDVILC